MASALTKRQQARNERALHDLLRSVPGNDRCADCGAKNPGWASWNLGIFLCMRCAGLHRKLGTHLSKVKSLSMDSWTSDQVESMKKTGNIVSNQLFNPKSVRADIPIDADEVEGAMERYIRRKYEHREFAAGNSNNMLGAATRQNTGSTGTGSWSEEPPPLPPKPGKKFGFSLRSASSSLPRPSRQERNFTPPLSPAFSGSDQDPTSPREMKPSNKPSQVFGMRITSSISNNFDQKLATLRDMGFSDSRRNSDVLKNVNGSLDKAVEALVRLEGSKPASRTETPAPRTLTPVSMGSQGVNGISVDKTRQAEAKNRDPWEVRETSPQRAATQPLPLRSASAAPAQNSWNPFMSQTQQPQQSTQGLENTFQNLQLSQPGPQQQQQYLQPQQQTYGQQGGLQNNPFQPAPNPWDSLNLPQQQPSQSDYMQQHFQQPTHTSTSQQPQISSNPFLRKAQSQTFPPSNIWDQPVTQPQQPLSAQQTGNPFGNFWQSPQPQPQPQPQYQQQQSFLQQPATQSPAPIFGQQQNYFSPPPQQPQPPPQQQQTWPPPDSRQQTQSPFSSTSNPWQQQPASQPASQPQPQSQPQQLMPQMTGMPAQQQQQQQQFQPQQHQPQQQPPQDQLWSYTPKDALPSSQPGRYDKASILAMYGPPGGGGGGSHMGLGGSSLQPVAEDGMGGGGGGTWGGMQQQQGQQGQMGYNPFTSATTSGAMNGTATATPAVHQPSGFASPPPPPSGAGGFASPAFSAQQPYHQQQQQQQQQQQPGYGQGAGGARHVSHESAAFIGFPGSSAGEGGRASPDAFAGLSAGYRFR